MFKPLKLIQDIFKQVINKIRKFPWRFIKRKTFIDDGKMSKRRDIKLQNYANYFIFFESSKRKRYRVEVLKKKGNMIFKSNNTGIYIASA